jgi:hypothetical protein
MIYYAIWDTNAMLMSTELGLYLWTHSAHRLGHVFVPMKDNLLWEWGL